MCKGVKKLDEIIDHPNNNNLWSIYPVGNGYIPMNKELILQKINDVLNTWENYGYWYFIGEGKCPRKPSVRKPEETIFMRVPSERIRQRLFGGRTNKKTQKTKKRTKFTNKKKKESRK